MRSDPAAEAARQFRRRTLFVLFWFLTVSLVFNSLFGDMGIIQGFRQRRHLTRVQREVATLHDRNDRLLADIRALRSDPWRIEAIAREELGLTRPGEILFLFPHEGTGDRPRGH
ncbi:MAG: FtsB family cell division protein [Candidatus Polarisedimenticolia bacterium]